MNICCCYCCYTILHSSGYAFHWLPHNYSFFSSLSLSTQLSHSSSALWLTLCEHSFVHANNKSVCVVNFGFLRKFVGWHNAKTRLLLYTLQTNGFEFSLVFFFALLFVALKLPLIEFFSALFNRIFPFCCRSLQRSLSTAAVLVRSFGRWYYPHAAYMCAF